LLVGTISFTTQSFFNPLSNAQQELQRRDAISCLVERFSDRSSIGDGCYRIAFGHKKTSNTKLIGQRWRNFIRNPSYGGITRNLIQIEIRFSSPSFGVVSLALLAVSQNKGSR
jgi:hypothetical protein